MTPYEIAEQHVRSAARMYGATLRGVRNGFKGRHVAHARAHAMRLIYEDPRCPFGMRGVATLVTPGRSGSSAVYAIAQDRHRNPAEVCRPCHAKEHPRCATK